MWELTHSVIANTTPQRVWDWHIDVDNWARLEGDAVESITVDGPFEVGARITTKMSGQDPRTSTVVEVEPLQRTAIEMTVSGAVVRFSWTFDELPDSGTRVTQRITLDGPDADAYVPFMEEHFAPNLQRGMERIVREIEATVM